MNPNFRECPLPDDLQAERFVLGTALSDPEAWPQITGLLGSEDFSLEKHKRIFLRMGELFERGEPINCADLAYELRKLNQLDSVDGLSYLVEIADVPRLLNLERFCERVRETSVRRQVILSAWLLIDRCGSNSYERGESLGELERIREILNTSRRRVAGRVWDEIVADEGGINSFLSPEIRPGIHIPFADIHRTLDGLRRGRFIILGARPAVGKTACAAQICEHAAQNGNNVLWVTLEMNAHNVLHRSITGRAAVSAYRFRRGTLTDIENVRVQSEASELASLGERLTILDDSHTTVQGIESLLRALGARNRRIDLVVVDYLQLLHSVGRFENRVQEVSAISRGLKRITQEFDIPLLALSQLTRQGEHKNHEAPQLDSLKESGQLEQDADQVLFFWLKKEPEENETERQVAWRVAKNRDGMLNRGALTFYPRYCRFEETAEEQQAA